MRFDLALKVPIQKHPENLVVLLAFNYIVIRLLLTVEYRQHMQRVTNAQHLSDLKVQSLY